MNLAHISRHTVYGFLIFTFFVVLPGVAFLNQPAEPEVIIDHHDWHDYVAEHWGCHT